MAISEAQRQEIIDLTGSMSVREIAKRVGASKDAVHRVQKSMRDSSQGVAKVSKSTTPARTRDKETAPSATVSQSVAQRVAVVYDTPLHIIGRQAIASTMTAQLVSELKLYEEAKARAEVDPQCKWEMVQHQKLIQSALRDLAKWCGLDKGTMPGADDTVDSVTEDNVRSMTLDDMLLLAKKL